MDLTFQVPMQYCSLQHWTLILSPVTSTAGYCFCFGSIPSFFLELFLHSSPVAYWAPTDLGSFSFSILSFCLFMAESEEELKSLLMKVKVESEKVGLKLSIQKTKIMASGPTTSWEIDGETVETVPDFIFLGSKITADGDCSHEIKRRLLLGRKVKIGRASCRERV